MIIFISNIEKIKDGIGDKIGIFFRGLSSFLSALIISFFINWKITLTICMLGPCCVFFMSTMAQVN